MSKNEILRAAMKLNPHDRRILGEKLLESVEETDDGLSPEQRAELLRRLEDHKRNPHEGYTLKQVDAYIDKKLKQRRK